MRHAVPTALALLIALVCSPAFAQWKWRDASGRITASDLPPPAAVPERDILARPSDQHRPGAAAKAAPAASAAASASRPTVMAGTDPELEARRKRVADEQAALQRQQQEKDAVVRAENCSRARSHLTALNDGQRLARTNAQGEREVLDDKGRAEEIQRARAIIASDCR